ATTGTKTHEPGIRPRRTDTGLAWPPFPGHAAAHRAQLGRHRLGDRAPPTPGCPAQSRAVFPRIVRVQAGGDGARALYRAGAIGGGPWRALVRNRAADPRSGAALRLREPGSGA